MKTEAYDYSTIDEAIERLQKLKTEGKNPKNVVILTMDFDNNTSSKKIASPDDGCLLVKKSKTIIMNEDEYIPHMQLFNTEQNIKNIIRRGIMHDILL
jgi:archaellum component FlaF (FlaF/FlaG flagellin family)